MQTLEQRSQALTSGALRARALVEQALERIADPSGQGAHAFISVNAQGCAGAGGRDRSASQLGGNIVATSRR